MARPNKQGLDYFSFDVDFFNDEKIEAISGEFGIKGEITTIKLLCAIYRNGYFIVWSELLKMKLLKNLNGVSSDLLEQIVKRLVKWSFFDETLFNSEKVLTSKGIQRRYLDATKRRKNIENSHYWLLKEVNVNINPTTDGVNVNIYPQSKVNESKDLKEVDNSTSKSGDFETPPDVNFRKKGNDKPPTEKKRKKVPRKKEKKMDLSFVSAEFLPLVEDFMLYRSKLQKPYKTERGVKKFYNELLSLSDNNFETAVKLIDYAKDNEWLSVYPIKENNSKVVNYDTSRKNNINDDPEAYINAIASGLARADFEANR